MSLSKPTFKRKPKDYQILPSDDPPLLSTYPPAPPLPTTSSTTTTVTSFPPSSHSSSSSSSNTTTSTSATNALKAAVPKGPSRTTKTSQKLTLFPDELASTQPYSYLDPSSMVVNETEDLYDQLAVIPPERIGKLDRSKLPRVSAYCTANSYRLDDLMTYYATRACVRFPKKFDECVYLALPTLSTRSTGATTTSTSSSNTNSSSSSGGGGGGSMTGLTSSNPNLHLPTSNSSCLDQATSTSHLNGGSTNVNFTTSSTTSTPTLHPTTPQQPLSDPLLPKLPKAGDLFFFDYGVVVCWGLTEEEEKTVLMELMPYEEDSLGYSNIETEKFAFHYNSNYQSRIYNDIISLKDPDNYMIKLTISHAIAQSTKLTLFEGLVEQTIAATKHIPQTMAETGKVHMNRMAITKKVGQLFIMRINVNLVSNVLDTPELFWAEPLFEPLYQAIRMYLEINQRVELLNQRVSVISDLLDMLREHLNSTHGEKLEWIVIMLIAFEIVIGIITICFDFLGYSGRAASDIS